MDFHPVAKVADLPEGDVQRFEIGEDAIAVVNLGNGDFSALADVCPHMGAWLGQGEVDVARGTPTGRHDVVGEEAGHDRRGLVAGDHPGDRERGPQPRIAAAVSLSLADVWPPIERK